MSLFFDVLIDDVCKSPQSTEEQLNACGKEFRMKFVVQSELRDVSFDTHFSRKFGFSRPIAYELRTTTDEDGYDLLYGDFGGPQMQEHYRNLARKMSIADWMSLEFGSVDLVDEVYKVTPLPIPCISFMACLIKSSPRRRCAFSFDHDNDNSNGCDEIVGTEKDVLQAAWMTIAFGYQWPNLRIVYDPQNETR